MANTKLHSKIESISENIAKFSHDTAEIRTIKDQIQTLQEDFKRYSLKLDSWIIKGQVTDNQGQPLDRQKVEVNASNSCYNGRLGACETDNKGGFEFIYRAERFSDLITEKPTPTIYVKVCKKNHPSEGLKWVSGQEVFLHISVS